MSFTIKTHKCFIMGRILSWKESCGWEEVSYDRISAEGGILATARSRRGSGRDKFSLTWTFVQIVHRVENPFHYQYFYLIFFISLFRYFPHPSFFLRFSLSVYIYSCFFLLSVYIWIPGERFRACFESGRIWSHKAQHMHREESRHQHPLCSARAARDYTARDVVGRIVICVWE